MYYSRKPNRVGGGARTNENGLGFEGRVSLVDAINRHDSMFVRDGNIFLRGEQVGRYREKHSFYKEFLEDLNVDWRRRISKKYLPDAVIINDSEKVVFVVEKKYQSGSGSVDEKLQTCDFKRKIYQQLLEETEYDVEYYYLLNSWYERPEYDDVKKYIKSVGCDYFIDSIELKSFGFL